MRSRSYLFLLIVLVLGAGSGFLYSQQKFNFGLDVRGGSRFIYQFDPDDIKTKKDLNLDQLRRNTIRVLEKRVERGLALTEATVASIGTDRFLIELPGFTDSEKAGKLFETSASIKFYHARNVVTELDGMRRYTVVPGDNDPNDPVVWFQRRVDGKVIKPADPEYIQIIKEWGEPIIQGEELVAARAEATGQSYRPLMMFSAEGSRKMSDWSRRHYNRRENLAAVLDDVVLSLAAVERETILSDNAIITGTFTPAYVTNLTSLLESGALPVDLVSLGSLEVEPSIGKFALDQMVMAGLAAFAFIALFLVVYYAFPGFVALVALFLYILFTLTVLKVVGATFSLAAIAGFILSVGMAVDANILVFERFKEEMKAGKSLPTALDLGFRRALPAIIDSNACTILTSLVLANLGTGPVKGFATTLIIGVAISLFTALTVTRSLLVFLVNSGIGSNPKWYALERNWFGEKFELKADKEPLQIVNTSRKWFLGSAISILVLLPFVFLGGLKPNVEFRGGFDLTYSLKDSSTTVAALQSKLVAAQIDGANVKIGQASDGRLAIISVPPSAARAGEDPSSVQARIGQAAGFVTDDFRGAENVSPTIRGETIRDAIIAVILSSALIILYLAFRFGVALGNFYLGLRFGFSAIGALLHDVLFVLGVSAITGYFFNWEISALFITSMLTVIGFSVHDTIVIFDRIRENLRKPLVNEDFGNLVNRSITQSFARSLNTSMTVIVTLMILLAFGTTTPDLKLFCVTMLAGIVSGTYSSIYNASPILYLWDKAVGKKRGEDSTVLGAAKREAAAARVITQSVPTAPSADGTPGRSYGQVRRRANTPQKSGKIEIEEPPDK